MSTIERFITSLVSSITGKWAASKLQLRQVQFFAGITLMLIAIGAFSFKLALATAALLMVVGAVSSKE